MKKMGVKSPSSTQSRRSLWPQDIDSHVNRAKFDVEATPSITSGAGVDIRLVGQEPASTI
ncbi:hypothetical protein PsorP6_008644 [Peronosclerospora sorghi]|uniref:Uncharacterized protein n=1 Tax=Peronosclerospora sorghi TaxID=230839 RepID=A0ACC0W977_9STRA|nr:hypothetical protein PsorP6_008644 [Peronosclerospora sorghi]